MEATSKDSLYGVIASSVQKVFKREGVTAKLESFCESVFVATFTFRIVRATQSDVNKVKTLAETIEANIGIDGVRVSQKSGLFRIEVPVGSGKRLWVENLPASESRTKVAVGLDSSSLPVVVDYKINPHIGFLGMTNFGKTSAAKSVIYQMMQQDANLDVYICCFKPADWEQFAGVATVVSEVNEILLLLKSANRLMEYRRKARITSPRVLIVLDDGTQFVDDKEVCNQLEQLAPLCRGMGIHLMPILQRTGGLGARFTSQISLKVMVKVQSATDAYTLSGQEDTGASKLRFAGDAILVNGDEITRIATLSMNEDTVLDSGNFINRPRHNFLSVEPSEEDLEEEKKSPKARLTELEKLVAKVSSRPEIVTGKRSSKEADYVLAWLTLLRGDVAKACTAVYGNKEKENIEFVESVTKL